MIVTMDEATHVYTTDDGRQMPSVTRILEATGIREPYRGDPAYGVRGTWCHRSTELVDIGDFDWSAAEAEHPDWIGFVRAYERFRDDNRIEILATEELVWSEMWWFAGTCDRRVLFNGQRTRLDFKTGRPGKSDVVQIALYDLTGEEAHDLLPVYLRSDGSYRAPPIPEEVQEEARAVGLAAARISRWTHRD